MASEESFHTNGASLRSLTTDTFPTSTSTGSGTSCVNITSDGGARLIASGICCSDYGNPTIADLTNGWKRKRYIFKPMTGLTTGRGYFVRAYATNSVGTSYGKEEYFIPTPPAAVSTLSLSYTAPETTAISGVYIMSDGGYGVLALGIVWGTTPNPTTTSNLGMTSENVGAGWYQSSTMTGLDNTGATTYYVRAYFTDGLGTSYYGQGLISLRVVQLVCRLFQPIQL